MKYEYLIFDLFIFFSSTLGVLFYPKGRFPKLQPFLFSSLVIIIPYLIWDYLVTNHWWSFNSRYITDIHLGKLPIEEVLFFIAVPWSCLVIWENLKVIIKNRIYTVKPEKYLIFLSFIFLVLSYLKNWHYSFSISLILFLVILFSFKTGEWLRSKVFQIFLSVVAITTLIFNGYLTSRPIVIYNSDVKSNINIGTIPIEDFFYGLVLISAITMIYEKKNRK